MTTKRIKIPIYHGKLTIHVCKDESEFEAIWKKYGFGGSSSDYDGIHFSKQDEHFIVLMENTTPSIIAHECLHFTNEVFYGCGIRIDIDNDEPQAYFLGWAVKQCHSVIDNLKRNA